MIFENTVDHGSNSLVALRFHCVGQSVLHLRRLFDLSFVLVFHQIFIRILVQRKKHLVPSLIELPDVATLQLDVEQLRSPNVFRSHRGPERVASLRTSATNINCERATDGGWPCDADGGHFSCPSQT